MPKHWTLRRRAPAALREQFPEIDPLLLQLLYGRGLVTQDAIDAFLEPDYSRDLHDPFLFVDMKKAVERLSGAITDKENIVVYGDYDADGVTASAVVVETLRALGAQPDVYIPFRGTEGYGLNVPAVEELHKDGVKVIVTVDCGTTNVREIERANELGMDVILTDHHDEPPVLPVPYALINPELRRERYPFRHLSGAGVAFKLAHALMLHTDYGKTLGVKPLPDGWEKWLLDLVAISTVTDMVTLLEENRVFVRFGLGVMKKGRRPGLRALFADMRVPIEDADEESLGFQIGPRLNAAGRMNHASTSFNLLVATDPSEAERLAKELSTANVERQRATENVFQQALKQVGDAPKEHLLYAIGESWPAGVVGLVASKLCERFNRPAIVITKSQQAYVGSGRSIDAFDITSALKKIGTLLDRYGGHPQACGFTVKQGTTPSEVGVALQKVAWPLLKDADLTSEVLLDSEVVLDDINWKLVEDVERLAPFGMHAERPRFLARGLRVIAVDTVGKDGKHLRLHVSHATSEVRKTIGFRFGAWVDKLEPGGNVDLVFEVGVNEWNNNREIELKIVDLDHARDDRTIKEHQ